MFAPSFIHMKCLNCMKNWWVLDWSPLNSFGSIPSSLTYLLSLGFSSLLSDAPKNFLENQGLLPPHPHSVFEKNWALDSFASVFSNGLGAVAVFCWTSPDISSWYISMPIIGQFFNKNIGCARQKFRIVLRFQLFSSWFQTRYHKHWWQQLDVGERQLYRICPMGHLFLGVFQCFCDILWVFNLFLEDWFQRGI